MVRFEKDKLIIEIESCFPTDTWLELYGAMLDLVRSLDADYSLSDRFYNIPILLDAMLPDSDQAKKLQQ